MILIEIGIMDMLKIDWMQNGRSCMCNLVDLTIHFLAGFLWTTQVI
jgi:hypothetical protein